MATTQLRPECAAQWHRAGGHTLERAPKALSEASCATFSLLQSAMSLDAAADIARSRLRDLNAPANQQAPVKRTRSNAPTMGAVAAADDVSDGSAVQGDLIAKNVHADKTRLPLPLADAANQRAPDGSLRLIAGDVLSEDECALLIAGGLVAMAGAFTRCGQTTLGLSPALAARMTAPAAASSSAADPPSSAADPPVESSIPHALPLLYRTVERVRRRVAAAFGTPLDRLRLSDATLTRLQPVDVGRDAGADGDDNCDDDAPAAAVASGSLDVGLLRGDQFCYWRPHIDQISVDEYEFSALLYLTRHTSHAANRADDHTPGATAHPAASAPIDIADGAAAAPPLPSPGSSLPSSLPDGADFDGGQLVFHDPDADRVILPQPGLLVAFTSGATNLHAVERVTHGSRFALTMWFTTRRLGSSAGVDPTHAAMQRWAASLPDPLPTPLPTPPHMGMDSAGGPPPLPPPPLPPPPLGDLAAAQTLHRLPSREESLVSAALCSLPANDPLGRALLLSMPGQHVGALSRGITLPPEHAHAAPRLSLDVGGGASRTPSGTPSGTLATMHPLLHTRASALEALLTTLRRARTERGAHGALSSHGQAASVPPQTDDGFDVFD